MYKIDTLQLSNYISLLLVMLYVIKGFSLAEVLRFSASSLSLVYRKGCGISCEVKLTKNPPSSTDRVDLGK